MWQRPANGTAEAELVYGDSDSPSGEGVWSPDGWLVVRRNPAPPEHPTSDIIGLRPGEDGEAEPLVVSDRFHEQYPAVSRDGRWLAYISNETGRDAVFVRPFPNVTDGKWQISNEGGVEPVWAHNGRELFFGDYTLTLTGFYLQDFLTPFEASPQGSVFGSSIGFMYPPAYVNY